MSRAIKQEATQRRFNGILREVNVDIGVSFGESEVNIFDIMASY
jgi:hypothetical protein